MAKGPLVLTVDDEPTIRRLIRLELESQDFDVIEAANGRSALAILLDKKPDAVVLDITMPGMSGLEVMAAMRELSAVPIILVTGRNQDLDKVQGLELGADDYIVKRFNPEELSARLRAVLRRYEAIETATYKVFVIGTIEVDLRRRLVRKAGQVIPLSRTEWYLLQYLAERSSKTILSSEILTQVWGPQYRNDLQYLRVWVSRLRAKIEPNPGTPTILITVPGKGYRFVVPTDE